MPFSKLFAGLILAGIVPILIGALFGWAFYVFVFYNALLFTLWTVDMMITPRPGKLEVYRECEEKFSLGADNEVVVKIRNNSRYYLHAEFKDTVPPYFKVINKVVKVTAAPHAVSEGKYSVIPEKRGQFEFGGIHGIYSGVLRLCRKKHWFAAQSSYKVYPNLQDLKKYSLAALNKSRLLYGVKKTRVYGIGTEFESLKEYADGDDYRKINWMATARSDKLVVNTYEPEKNQQVFILLDCSRVMNSEINHIKKLDYAINSAFVLTDAVLKKGDNTGLLVFDSSVKRYIKPGKGPGQFQLIAENLYNVEENFVTADYMGALSYLNEYQKRRSLLCIFTELFNTDEALNLAATIRSVAKRHIPLVITIKDERLYETAALKIREANDVYLKSAAEKLIEEREKIKRIFQDSGIASIDIAPDKLSLEVLNKYLTMKAMLQI